MQRKLIIFAVLFFIPAFCSIVYAQDEWTQKKWEDVRDSLAVDAIKMLARIDTINLQIDSLNKVSEYIENLDCEAELYKIVGATKEEVSEFRNKFVLTEQKVNSNSGTPGEVRSSYYGEISESKITCLPEFNERFLTMKRKMNEWENKKEVVVSDSLYVVSAGDYLKKIAREKYGNWKLWTLIWDANKNGVVNAEELLDNYKKKVTNPDKIYPGQILRIPAHAN